MNRGSGTVVFLTHTGALSGAELAFVRLASALRRAGFSTSAVLTEPGPLLGELAEAGVPACVVASSFATREITIAGSFARLVRGGFQMLAAGWAAGAAVRAAGGSAVVAESTKALLMGVVASRRAGVPLIWHVHDRVTAEYFGRIASIIRCIGLVAAAGFLANSEGTLAALWTGRRPKAVSYPGVELRRVPERLPQRPPEQAQLVMVGRLTEWKGQDLVLEALALSRAQAPIRFVGGAHFGEEDYARSLRERADRLGLSARACFVGHVADPMEEAARADVAVHYSRLTEPFGQVVVEAMAAGCAVVATGGGGPQEIIDHEVHGLLVAPGDPEALAQAIDRLVADQGLRERLAAAGRARARDFATDAVARPAAELLRRVAPGTSPPSARPAAPKQEPGAGA